MSVVPSERRLYSAVHGFWPVEELAELADKPTGCGEVARGGCLFAWNIGVTRPALLTEAERRARSVDQTEHDAVAALVTRS